MKRSKKELRGKMDIKANAIEIVPTGSLKAHPRNRNRHSLEQLQWLGKIIKHSGFREPINVSNLSGCIICGHARWEVAKMLGMEEVPIIREDYASESEEYQHLTADNEISRMAELDYHGLMTDLKEIEFDLDLELLGVKFDLPIEPSDTQDNMPVGAETRVTRGDTWMLGDHALMCGDSTNVDDVTNLMNFHHIDMIYTDPPYGVDYSLKAQKLNKDYGGERIEKDIENDKVEQNIGVFWNNTFTAWLPYMNEFSSWYVSSPQAENLLVLWNAMKQTGFNVRQCLIWAKNNHVIGGSDYMYKHEPILYGRTKNTPFYKKGLQNKSVIEVDKPLKNDLHPTMKPVELIENFILNSTELGMTVADMFLGSGSTLIACEKTGRICYGMEMDENYCDVILKRWEDFTGKTAVRVG